MVTLMYIRIPSHPMSTKESSYNRQNFKLLNPPTNKAIEKKQPIAE